MAITSFSLFALEALKKNWRILTNYVSYSLFNDFWLEKEVFADVTDIIIENIENVYMEYSPYFIYFVAKTKDSFRNTTA